MEINILDLSASDARRFFLKQESFCNIGLPPYFDFQPLLDRVFTILEKRGGHQDATFKLDKIIKDISLSKLFPGNYNDVNYIFYHYCPVKVD